MNRYGALLLTGLILLPHLTGATEFYVSSIHPSRNDTNTGDDPDFPWESMSKVQGEWHNDIQPGDTVHMHRGSRWEWTESRFWRITLAGNAVEGAMVLRGDDYGTGAQPVIAKKDATTIEAFKISNAVKYLTLRDFTIDGNGDNGAYTTAIFVGGHDQDAAAEISHLQFINLTLRNLAYSNDQYTAGIWLQAYNDGGISDVLIQGCDVSGHNAHGINVYAFKDSNPHASTNSRIVCRNNRIHSPNPYIYGNVGSGIHVAFGGADNVYEYNYITGKHPAGGFYLMNCANNETNLVIRYNVIEGNETGPGITIAADLAGATDSILSGRIYGNLITGCRQAGIWVWSRDFYSGRLGLYNNTLHGNNRIGTVEWDSGAQILVHDESTGMDLDVRNNLLSSTNDNTACLHVQSGYAGVLTHSNNLYWRPDGSPVVYDRGATYTVTDVADYEPSAKSGDPLFVDPSVTPASVSSAAGVSPDGFALRPLSPALEAGATLDDALSGSIDGLPRPQASAWDIGAYEGGFNTKLESGTIFFFR